MPSFHFKGKSFLENYHHTVKFHKLNSRKEKCTSESPSLNDNLLVHGDNLKALKSLLPTHAGRVKCIYIDPPYNTGNEHWEYNDNVASPMIQEWLGKEVSIDDLTRHDKWCCMMYPRLTLLRELLADDGVIFVSIDDNEAHRLRMMLDDIFGDENFIGQFVWKRRASSALAEKLISADHEYVLTYQKTEAFCFKGKAKDFAAYSNSDDDPRGEWVLGDLTVGMTSKDRPNQFYELVNPKTGEKFAPNPNRVWAYIPESMAKLIEEDRVVFPKGKRTKPMLKRFRADLESKVNPISTWLDVGMNSEATKQIQDIFGDNQFNYSKPLSLVKSLIESVTSDGDLVLDSFAGSGTTAHAVLALNQEDGGNRKFILVECEDYADTITAERIRRVIKGVPNAKDEALKKGLGGSFSYYELGEELEMDKLLEGEDLPTFDELARYAFFTATGENWDESKKDTDSFYIGSSNTFEVFQLYTPDKEKLKKLALNLDFAMKIQERFPSRQKLVFAPACFMEEYHLKEFGIRFAQLPFEIYRMAE